jgi:acyl-CoA hydrolase
LEPLSCKHDLFCILGSGVVTTRAHVHYVVTEYGIAYMFGKNIRQRAYELIKIAHPVHRERLEKEVWFMVFNATFNNISVILRQYFYWCRKSAYQPPGESHRPHRGDRH